MPIKRPVSAVGSGGASVGGGGALVGGAAGASVAVSFAQAVSIKLARITSVNSVVRRFIVSLSSVEFVPEGTGNYEQSSLSWLFFAAHSPFAIINLYKYTAIIASLSRLI
jgi:SH3-like domain-containing protein